MQQELITSAEARKRLGGIHASTLARWVQTGRLTPAMKAPGLRGAFFFTAEEIERVRREVAA